LRALGFSSGRKREEEGGGGRRREEEEEGAVGGCTVRSSMAKSLVKDISDPCSCKSPPEQKRKGGKKKQDISVPCICRSPPERIFKKQNLSALETLSIIF
jgi:hypothetical protein